MASSKIHNFQEFSDFHHMAQGAVKSIHPEIQVFELQEVGDNAVKKTPLFKTNFFQIGLFNKVNFEISYFGENRIVEHKNVIVLFKPGQTVSFTKADDDSWGYIIMFKESFIDYKINNYNTLKDFSILNPENDCVLFLDDISFNDITDISKKLYYEYKKIIEMGSVNICKLYCQIIIEKINIYSKNLDSPIPNSSSFNITSEFKKLVFQNIHNTKKVSDYAEMLNITEKTLINYVKNHSSLTPKDFINQVIIQESKALLKNNSSIDIVTQYFNFTDQAHFSNFFKRMTGINPSQFKKLN